MKEAIFILTEMMGQVWVTCPRSSTGLGWSQKSILEFYTPKSELPGPYSNLPYRLAKDHLAQRDLYAGFDLSPEGGLTSMMS